MPHKAKSLTPKKIRELLEEGRYEYDGGRVPTPPQEWKPWKRAALSRCISAAWLFMRGWNYGEIRTALEQPDITRQRVAQMVATGCKFFLQRDWIRPKAK